MNPDLNSCSSQWPLGVPTVIEIQNQAKRDRNFTAGRDRLQMTDPARKRSASPSSYSPEHHRPRLDVSYTFVKSVIDLLVLVQRFYSTPAILRGDFNSVEYNIVTLDLICLRSNLHYDEMPKALTSASRVLREINSKLNRGVLRGLDITMQAGLASEYSVQWHAQTALSLLEFHENCILSLKPDTGFYRVPRDVYDMVLQYTFNEAATRKAK